MEIERKFLIDRFPDLPLIYKAKQYQGYISINPVVRIRQEVSEYNEKFVLCFKGQGTLAREEIEIDINKETFNKLKDLLNKPLIEKDYRVYSLDNHRLECSLVDKGMDSQFMYAEIEFSTIDEAVSYTVPEFLSNEVTEVPGYTMSEYWEIKNKNLEDMRGKQ